MRKLLLALASLASALLGTSAAHAQTQCGVFGEATAPTTITYDPFSPSGLSQVTVPLMLVRGRGPYPGLTREASLVLTVPPGSPAYKVTYQGANVLYTEGATGGRPRPLSDSGGTAWGSGEIRYTFGGTTASDASELLNLLVTVPPGADLSSGRPIEFDILYVCRGEGGLASITTPTKLARGLRINVNVVSALQAYYAGSALDFGEIGNVTTAQVQAAPGTYTTSANNSVRVKSSGPYEVRVQSQNNFNLTFPGGNLSNANQTIGYRARFLGTDITSNSSFGTKTCVRAGVTGAEGVLPVRATLLEGGAGKAASTNYSDVITVTFTPVVSGSSTPLSCGSLQ